MLVVDKHTQTLFKSEVMDWRNHYQKEIKEQKAELKRQKKILRMEKKAHNQDEVNRVSELLEKLEGTLVSLYNRKEPFDFPTTEVLPVKFGGHIYNAKLLQKFEHKLKDYSIQMTVERGGTMVVTYEKGASHGRLELQPLSNIFYNLPSIPEAKARHSYMIKGGK